MAMFTRFEFLLQFYSFIVSRSHSLSFAWNAQLGASELDLLVERKAQLRQCLPLDLLVGCCQARASPEDGCVDAKALARWVSYIACLC